MNYSKTKVKDLSNLCAKYNLATEGTKDELIDRLKAYEASKETVLFEKPAVGKVEVQEPLRDAHGSFFIHLNADNFSYYLNSGVIVPLELLESEVYRKQNRKKDILSNYPGHVIISRQPFSRLEAEDVMVEIEVSGIELKELTPGVFSSLEPIPISRVKSLIFPGPEGRQRFLTNVNIYPDSFFPERLCEVTSKRDSKLQAEMLPVTLPDNPSLILWRERLKRMDRVLGMFSFMRNAGIIYAERDSLYQELTPYFFYALSMVYESEAPVVDRDAPVFKYMLSPDIVEQNGFHRMLFKRIVDAIYADQDFHFEGAVSIMSEAIAAGIGNREEERDLQIAIELFIKLGRQQAIFKDLLINETIRRHYPIWGLLLLAQFSNRSKTHTDKQAVRNVFIQNTAIIPRNAAEFLLGLLGLYYGYGNMIKADTNLHFAEPYFAVCADHEQAIKIRHFSSLERILLESAFIFCKTGKAAPSSLAVGKDSGKRSVGQRPENFQGGKYSLVDQSYEKWGTVITIIERRDQWDELLDLINKHYPARVPARSQLAHYILSTFGTDKRVLLNFLAQNKERISTEALKGLVDFDIAEFSRK